MKKILLILHVAMSQICLSQSNISYNQIGEKPIDVNSSKKTKVYSSDNFVFYLSDFDIDADGHPKAYNHENTGLLHNVVAGYNSRTGKYSPSVIVHNNRVPVIQKSNEPAPGYLISSTSLKIEGYSDTVMERYVNPESIPYIVYVNSPRSFLAHVGDYALVYNTANKIYSYAIFADGNNGIIGEGSMKLAQNLDLPIAYGNTRTCRNCRIIGGGTDSKSVLYIILKNSTHANGTAVDKKYLTEELIKKEASEIINRLGYNTEMDLINTLLPLAH